MQLQTDRLLLRHWQPNDWVAVHEYAADLAVIAFMSWGPNSEAETKVYIDTSRAQYEERPQRDFELAVVEREGDAVIGGASIHITSVENREAYIGYTLRHESWGRGYATEIAQRLLRFGFGELHLHRIFATCDPRNQRSRHVLEKIGMAQEGHFRENVWMRGTWRDSLVYAILEDRQHPDQER
jgi:RimJ/RimL family protein N-acetyltransferase